MAFAPAFPPLRTFLSSTSRPGWLLLRPRCHFSFESHPPTCRGQGSLLFP